MCVYELEFSFSFFHVLPFEEDLIGTALCTLLSWNITTTIELIIRPDDTLLTIMMHFSCSVNGNTTISLSLLPHSKKE